jgi:aminoglycoside phosphotransferase (APT) family kinase protein
VGSPTLDDAALADGLSRWLAHRRGVDQVHIDQVEHPSVGYSSSTTLLRARWARDEPMVQHLVVRMAPAPAGTFADYDLRVQDAAQRAASDPGVPMAEPFVTETDPSWLGAPFMVMPRIDGHIIGEAPPFDSWLRALGVEGQAAIHDRFLQSLATIHRADIQRAGAGGVPRRDDAAELQYWDAYLRWSCAGEPLPPLVDALAWCREHAPATADDREAVLCWGDVRLGNVVFDDDLRPRAVLDWDMAVIGAPEHDLAWFTELDATMTALTGRRVDGFPDRAGTIARYQELAGRELRSFEWYETLALLRSTAILTRIGYLTAAAGKTPALPLDDNPVLDLLRTRTAR